MGYILTFTRGRQTQTRSLQYDYTALPLGWSKYGRVISAVVFSVYMRLGGTVELARETIWTS